MRLTHYIVVEFLIHLYRRGGEKTTKAVLKHDVPAVCRSFDAPTGAGQSDQLLSHQEA